MKLAPALLLVALAHADHPAILMQEFIYESGP